MGFGSDRQGTLNPGWEPESIMVPLNLTKVFIIKKKEKKSDETRQSYEGFYYKKKEKKSDETRQSYGNLVKTSLIESKFRRKTD